MLPTSFPDLNDVLDQFVAQARASLGRNFLRRVPRGLEGQTLSRPGMAAAGPVRRP